jgi:hypothetical protein
VSRGGGQALTVAISARLVDTSTATIVWAAAQARTVGNDDSLFGGGGTPSLAKLTQQVVDKLVASMVKGKSDIAAFAKPLAPKDLSALPVLGAPSNGAPPAVHSPTGPPEMPPAEQPALPPPSAPAAAASMPAAPSPASVAGAIAVPADRTDTTAAAGPNRGARFLDEAREWTLQDMKAFLPDKAGGASRVELTTMAQCMPGLDAAYRTGTSGVLISVFDLAAADQCKAAVRSRCRNATESTFEGLPAFTYTSEFGFVHLGIVAGRFAVYVRGPDEEEELVRKVGSAIIKGMR